MTLPRFSMISFDVTDRCNLRCYHCRSHLGAFQPRSSEIFHILREVAKLRPRIITLSGGEPLLRGDIFEVISRAHEIGAEVQLNTNGLLVSDQVLDKVASSNVEYVQVSLEGPRPIHDSIRGDGTFDRSIDACRRLSGMTRLIINTTVSRYNIAYLEEIAENLLGPTDPLTIYMWGLNRFVPFNVLADRHALGSEGLSHLVHLWQTLCKRYPEALIKTDVPQTNLLNEDYVRGVMDRYGIHCAGCSAGVEALTVRANGDVSPCPTLPISCGNLHVSPIEEVLEHRVLRSLRDRDALQGACNSCGKRQICGGCRALAYVQSGEILAPDPECYGAEPQEAPALRSRRSRDAKKEDLLQAERRTLEGRLLEAR